MSVQASWHGDEIKAAARAAVALGLNQAGEQLLSSSQELTPVDTGDLRRSGSLHPASPAELVVRVVFNTPYAIEQHENLGFYHPTDKNPQAQAKFLETPLRRDEEMLLALVAATFHRALGGAG